LGERERKAELNDTTVYVSLSFALSFHGLIDVDRESERERVECVCVCVADLVNVSDESTLGYCDRMQRRRKRADSRVYYLISSSLF